MNYLIISEVCVFILALISIITTFKAKYLSDELKVEKEINKNLQERHTKTINDLAKIRLEKEDLQAKNDELILKLEKLSVKKPTARKTSTKETKKEETVKATRIRKTKKTE